MRLFFKHLLRSLRQASLQPLLILLTVICSTAIAVTSVRIPSMFQDHARSVALSETELGEILITVKGNNPMRLLFRHDAEEIIGEDGRVFGEFRLTGFTSQNGSTDLLRISAADLVNADHFYELQYLAYGSFTVETLAHSVILSRSCAESLGVTVGDTLSLRILEEEKTFTVQAIALDFGLFSDTDLLIPIESVIASLAARVPVIASLGDSFRPCTRLAVIPSDDVTAGQLAERLSASEAFQGHTVTLTNNVDQFNYLMKTQLTSLWIPALLLIILTAYLILTSLKLLQYERSEQAALFALCGAEPGQLASLQYGEGLLYGILGALGGVALSMPLIRTVSSFYEWQREPLSLDLSSALFGLLFAPLLMLACVSLHMLRQPRSLAQRLQGNEAVVNPESNKKALLPLILTAVCFCCTFAFPNQHRLIPATVTLLLAVWLLSSVASPLIRFCARLLEAMAQGAKRPIPWLLTGLKQLRHCQALQHVGQIATLALVFLLTVARVTSVLSAQQEILLDSITAEQIIVNADAVTEQELKTLPAVRSTERLGYFPSLALSNGVSVFGVSVEGDGTCLSDRIRPAHLPVGHQAVLTEGLATLINAKAGDVIELTVNGVTLQVLLLETFRSTLPLIYFDARVFGLSNDMLCINTDPSYPAHSAEGQALTAELEQRGCISINTSTLFRSMPESFSGLARTMSRAMQAAGVIAAMGIANSISEQYKRRRHERFILRSCGMTRTSLCGMQVLEIGALLGFSLLLALPFYGLFCLLLDIGTRAFGIVFLL